MQISAMLFHEDMIYFSKQAKHNADKALLRDDDRSKIEPRTEFLQFYVNMKKICRCSSSFSTEGEPFTHGKCITALFNPSDE